MFLALAVGIVLGSGPLKDDISGFLEDRTEQLGQEKVELQDEVSALRSEHRLQREVCRDLATGAHRRPADNARDDTHRAPGR